MLLKKEKKACPKPEHSDWFRDKKNSKMSNKTINPFLIFISVIFACTLGELSWFYTSNIAIVLVIAIGMIFFIWLSIVLPEKTIEHENKNKKLAIKTTYGIGILLLFLITSYITIMKANGLQTYEIAKLFKDLWIIFVVNGLAFYGSVGLIKYKQVISSKDAIEHVHHIVKVFLKIFIIASLLIIISDFIHGGTWHVLLFLSNSQEGPLLLANLFLHIYMKTFLQSIFSISLVSYLMLSK
ncbi:hypothetical protein ACFL56_00960 [Candidatus Margulisiibacteriota bacterium]